MKIRNGIAVAACGTMAFAGLSASFIPSLTPVAMAATASDSSGSTGTLHAPFDWFTGDVSNAFNLNNVLGNGTGLNIIGYINVTNAGASSGEYATVADAEAGVKFSDLTPSTQIFYAVSNADASYFKYVTLNYVPTDTNSTGTKPDGGSVYNYIISDGVAGSKTFNLSQVTNGALDEACGGLTSYTPSIVTGTANADGTCTINYTPASNGAWGEIEASYVNYPNAWSSPIVTLVRILIAPAKAVTPTPTPTPSATTSTPSPSATKTTTTPSPSATKTTTTPAPVVYVTDTKTFQIDRMTWKGGTYWANRYFSMANDGILKASPDEGKALGIWAQLGTGKYLTEKATFVTVSVKHVKGTTVSNAAWAAAVNAKALTGATNTNRVVTTTSASGSKTYVWVLGTGATVLKPFGPSHTINQGFIAHS